MTAHRGVNYQQLTEWCDCIVDTRNVLGGDHQRKRSRLRLACLNPQVGQNMTENLPSKIAEPEIEPFSIFQLPGQFTRKHFSLPGAGRESETGNFGQPGFADHHPTAVSFIVLPISVRYLGNEGYGLMATITAVVGWLRFGNMGIGQGLQGALTEETAKGNRRAQSELASTAVISLFRGDRSFSSGSGFCWPSRK